ncbi:MAG: hydrogenase 4 subunit F [Prevotellaceae bacterium]|jgi:hydrogenase-4 component F|nr:hydrogenase 4 subunit F [Prevotellaceae bacterium]
MILLYFIAALVSVPLLLIQRNKKSISIIAGFFFAIQLTFAIYTVLSKGVTELHFFTYDALGILFFALLSVLAPITLIHSYSYLHEETIQQYRLYHIGFILLSTAITGAYFSNNITVSWILIEITTLSAALLIYHRRTPRSLEATWKYVFVCSTGIAIAYLGILFLSVLLHGEHELNMSYENLANVVSNANPLYLKLAFLFILVGYSTKIELFPMYTIGIDANHAAPSPMSAFFSTALVNLGFVSVFRVVRMMASSEIFAWIQGVLLIAGILSLLVAAVYMRRTKNAKRFLAYSTVENMGIVAIAMGAGGVGYVAAIFHMLMHGMVKSTAFYQFSQVGRIYNSYNMFRMGRYFGINPLGATVLILALAGLCAVPPSSLFISELMTFSSLITADRWLYFVLATLLLCVVIYSLCSRLLHICYNSSADISKVDKSAIKPYLTYIQLVLILASFFFCFYQPDWLMSMLQEITAVFSS